jgi:pantoate--beta-alanine ligase
MKIAKTRKEVIDWTTNQVVGFVPTMGALHDGHLHLVRTSKERGLFTVVSIFVNPTQFNDANDFEKYPVNHHRDIEALLSSGCDLVFIPSVDEVYRSTDDPNKYKHDFGAIERVYEGAQRPGHFEGVGRVVHILFDIVKPNVAFFGEKDFQQLAVIRALVSLCKMEMEIVGVPTVREKSGLAMSSRNERLSTTQRDKAVLIFNSLSWAKSQFGKMSNSEICHEVAKRFEADLEWNLEYIDLIDGDTFESAQDGSMNIRAVIAAKLGEIRLIDNMKITA